MSIKHRFFTFFIISLLLTSPLFAEPETTTKCLSIELTIHNKTKQLFYLPFQSNSSSENIQVNTLVKPNDTVIIQTSIKKIEAVGYLSFSIDLGNGKSIHIMDPFTTYQSVFSVQPGDNTEDLQVIVNSKKMNEQGMCLLINAADISIHENHPDIG